MHLQGSHVGWYYVEVEISYLCLGIDSPMLTARIVPRIDGGARDPAPCFHRRRHH